MEENNKGLVWLVVFLIILVLGLAGYIVYDKVLSTDKNLQNENAIVDKNDLEQNDSIKVSIKQEKSDLDGNYNKLIINDKSIDLDELKGVDVDNIIFMDNSHIIVTYKDKVEGNSTYYIFNNAGTKLYNLNELSNLENGKVIEAHYSENALHIKTVTRLVGDNYQSLCELNQSDIYSKFEVINYLGDGKFEEVKTISEYTVKEYLEIYYNHSCN